MSIGDMQLFLNGEFITFPGLRLWCEMNYPGDRLAALRAWENLRTENHAMQAGRQSGYSRIGRLIMKDINRALILGKLCGLVAVQVQQNIAQRETPALGKAVYLVSDWASTQKTVSGKRLPSDAKRLSDQFRRYRPVIHYWAAFMLVGDADAIEGVLQQRLEFDNLLKL